MITTLLFLFFSHIAFSLSNFPIVHTSYGAVRGYEFRAKNGFVGEIFKKIPYASPPTGARRWRKPEPPSVWNFTLDGTFFGPACAQVPSQWSGYVTGMSEDCLTLNIYTSRQCRESETGCPVAVYVHGGSVLFSGPLLFLDDVLVTNYASQGVVLVTIAYRLGVFGVLALGDENALPANLALHDTIESLRFVRKEIAHFGGDKDQITLMGHSAGASIVLALAFSPAVNKVGDMLFTRAIMMSAVMNFWKEENIVERSRRLTAILGCSGSAQETIDCLRLLSANEILQAAHELGGMDMLSLKHISGLTIAGQLLPFQTMKDLRDNHAKRMKETGKPFNLLIGTTLNEFRAFGGLPGVGNNFDLVLNALGVRNREECEQKYMDDVKIGRFVPEYDTESQAAFITTSMLANLHESIGGEVYLYEWDYTKHARHADDLYYAMSTPYYTMNDDENWLYRVYPMYFANFTKGLPPAPEWTPLNPQLMNYYSINRSITDGVIPKMKLGYQRYLTDYYVDMMKFDERLTKIKKNILQQPVQYKDLFLISTKPFTFVDLIFYSILLGVALLIIQKVYEMCKNGRRYESMLNV